MKIVPEIDYLIKVTTKKCITPVRKNKNFTFPLPAKSSQMSVHPRYHGYVSRADHGGISFILHTHILRGCTFAFWV